MLIWTRVKSTSPSTLAGKLLIACSTYHQYAIQLTFPRSHQQAHMTSFQHQESHYSPPYSSDVAQIQWHNKWHTPVGGGLPLQLSSGNGADINMISLCLKTPYIQPTLSHNTNSWTLLTQNSNNLTNLLLQNSKALCHLTLITISIRQTKKVVNTRLEAPGKYGAGTCQFFIGCLKRENWPFLTHVTPNKIASGGFCFGLIFLSFVIIVIYLCYSRPSVFASLFSLLLGNAKVE